MRLISCTLKFIQWRHERKKSSPATVFMKIFTEETDEKVSEVELPDQQRLN